MPILTYFVIVSPALSGVLLIVGAIMGTPGPMPLTTSATGLPVAYVAPKTLPNPTVAERISPEIPAASEIYALASPTVMPAPSASAKNKLSQHGTSGLAASIDRGLPKARGFNRNKARDARVRHFAASVATGRARHASERPVAQKRQASRDVAQYPARSAKTTVGLEFIRRISS
jgi:hypothetical protein